MRICHLNLAKNYRGGERQTELLLRELSRRGWQQRLVGRHGSELLARCEDVEGVEIVATQTNVLAAGRATSGCSLTHAHEARGVYASLYGAWLHKIPFVITRRTVRAQKKSWLRDRAYRNAGTVAAVSAATARHIGETYPDLDIVVVPDAHAGLPVDAECSTALREQYAGKLLIVHIGTYKDSAKGQLTIIEAARRAVAEQPDWQFLMLGDGKDKARFAEEIGSLPNIELTGFVDNVGDYLAAADVFVFPSRHEPFGSSLLDAMHFGLPIVASRVDGIPEFVEDGVNGTLIDSDAAGQLFDGIARYAVDSPELGAMQLANRAQADKYNVGRMTDAYEGIYRREENVL